MHCTQSSAKWHVFFWEMIAVGIGWQGMELAHRNHRTTSFHLKQMQWPNSHTPNPHSPLHSWFLTNKFNTPNPLEVGTLHTFSPVASQNKVVLAVTLHFQLVAMALANASAIVKSQEWQNRPALLSQVSDRCCLVTFFSALLVANVCKCAVIANVRCSVFFLGKTCFLLYAFLKWMCFYTYWCISNPKVLRSLVLKSSELFFWLSIHNHLSWLPQPLCALVRTADVQLRSNGPRKSSSKQFDVAKQILYTWLPPLQVVERDIFNAQQDH